MNSLVAKAQSAIEQRLAEIEEESKRLRQALRDLEGAGSKPREVSPRSSRSGRLSHRAGSAKRRRGPSARTKTRVIEYLRAHPEASTAEVVAALSLKDGRVVGAQRRKLSRS